MADNSREQTCWAAGQLVCGIDEAGYGCLAGRMWVAGVVFGKGYDFSQLAGLNDSKQLTEEVRFRLEPIVKRDARWWFCASASPAEIDAENAYWLRFRKAEERILAEEWDKVVFLMDGDHALRLPSLDSRCLKKGDAQCLTIAAASILAKCAKDREMIKLDGDFPKYGWAQNKGYGTPDHKAAIEKFGLTEHHRRKYCRNIKESECS
jgi:ribonuclease HII